jgi:hypothetical protein
MNRVLTLIAVMAVASCATTAVPTDQATPASEVLDPSVMAARENAGKLIIKRDAGFVGSACAIQASVNGRPLANLRQGEAITLYLDAGEYILRASSKGICGGGDAESPLLLRAGEVRTYRISIDQGSSICLGPTAQ